MRLTAYSITDVGGVWQTWDKVKFWQVQGPTLIVTFLDDNLQTVQLPRGVIGLADNSPKTPQRSTATHYQERREHRATEPPPLTVPRARPVKYYHE
jgi:hypothetical protein